MTGLQAQQLTKGKWADLEKRFEHSEQLLVVNFWATWCRPCVAEMPHFEAVADEYADQGVDLLFVSADDPDYFDEQLPAFLERKAIQHPVFLMDDTNPNNWVGEVDADWQGDLPATLLIDADGQPVAFRNGSMSEAELRAFIDTHLQ